MASTLSRAHKYNLYACCRRQNINDRMPLEKEWEIARRLPCHLVTLPPPVFFRYPVLNMKKNIHIFLFLHWNLARMKLTQIQIFHSQPITYYHACHHSSIRIYIPGKAIALHFLIHFSWYLIYFLILHIIFNIFFCYDEIT